MFQSPESAPKQSETVESAIAGDAFGKQARQRDDWKNKRRQCEEENQTAAHSRSLLKELQKEFICGHLKKNNAHDQKEREEQQDIKFQQAQQDFKNES